MFRSSIYIYSVAEFSVVLYNDKMTSTTYHKAVPKSNRQIIERSTIETLNTSKRPLTLLGSGTLFIKRRRVRLLLWAQTNIDVDIAYHVFYPFMTVFTDQYSLSNMFFYSGQLSIEHTNVTGAHRGILFSNTYTTLFQILLSSSSKCLFMI